MSEVSICNLALSHIGAYRIQSLSDLTKEARQCSLLYGHARDAALRDHDWGFAKKEITLALLSDTYAGWDYAYQYPSDCLIAREIYDDTGNLTGTSYDVDSGSYVQVGRIEFEIRVNSSKDSRIILTNKEDAVLLYTAKVTDTNLFDPLFVDAFAWRLASDLAQPILGKPNLQQGFMNQYYLTLGIAKSENANEGHKKPDNDNSFTRARL